MAEKPKKKLPDGTLVDVDILAAEAEHSVKSDHSVEADHSLEANHSVESDHSTNADVSIKAEHDINDVPLTGRVVDVKLVTNIDGYDDIVFYFENGKELVISVTSVINSTFSDRSNTSTKATHDDQGNIIHQTYLPRTGGEIVGDIKLNSILYSNAIYSLNHHSSNGVGAQAIVCDESGIWHLLTEPNSKPTIYNTLVVLGQLNALNERLDAISEVSPELIDTFKEVADYMTSDESGATELLAAVNQNKTDISNIKNDYLNKNTGGIVYGGLVLVNDNLTIIDDHNSTGLRIGKNGIISGDGISKGYLEFSNDGCVYYSNSDQFDNGEKYELATLNDLELLKQEILNTIRQGE